MVDTAISPLHLVRQERFEDGRAEFAENEIALIDEVIRERRSLSPSSLSDRLVERETVEAILKPETGLQVTT